MASKDPAAVGIYQTEVDVESALNALRLGGFPNTDVSVLFPDSQSNDQDTQDISLENSSKTPEGTAAGATTGIVIGGVLGWLVGIGALAIPGVGPFIAAGPIVAALAGVSVGGAVGGFAGALIGIGIPESAAKSYERRLKNGGILLSVHCDDSKLASKARQILLRTGAQDISSTVEYGGRSITDKPLPNIN